MNNDTGVYAITSPSGSQYIGSAVSFKRRWMEHRKELRGGRHHSAALQNAWDKYGEENMAFSRLALCAVTELILIEQRFIDRLAPEYNISKIAGAPMLGARHTPESIRRISEGIAGERHPLFGVSPSAETRSKIGAGRKGKPHSAKTLQAMSDARRGSANVRARGVVCVETGQMFATLTDAADMLRSLGKAKALAAGISAACLGINKSAYGFHWRYADQQNTRRE